MRASEIRGRHPRIADEIIHVVQIDVGPILHRLSVPLRRIFCGFPTIEFVYSRDRLAREVVGRLSGNTAAPGSQTLTSKLSTLVSITSSPYRWLPTGLAAPLAVYGGWNGVRLSALSVTALFESGGNGLPQLDWSRGFPRHALYGN